jgi:hypothetical protein
MPSKKQSRNNKQVSKPKAEVTNKEEDDWGAGSIVVKSAPSSRGSTRSNKSEPKPEPPKPEWERVGMTEEDYKAMCERVAKEMLAYQLEQFKASMIADLDSASYWCSRLEALESQRARYNQKRGWSAEVIAEVDRIDADIAECEKNLERIEEEDMYEEIGAY